MMSYEFDEFDDNKVNDWEHFLLGANKDLVSSSQTTIFPPPVGQNKSAVFLAGGGEDSAAALLSFCLQLVAHPTQNDDIVIHPVYIDYGQLVRLPEVFCINGQIQEAARFLRERGINNVRFESLRILSDPLEHEIVESKGLLTGGTNSHVIEYRNIRYITTAASYAYLKSCTWLIAGLAPVILAIDNGFAATLATQLALNQNILDESKRVRLYAPFVWSHRSATISFLHNAAPSCNIKKYTFSCYTPKVESLGGSTVYIPCEKCTSCQVRASGHRLSGNRDTVFEIVVQGTVTGTKVQNG